MIREVELSNFRSISNGKVVLTRGINFIHGLNGAGKSTFLDAVAFALYGSEWARKSGVKLQSFVKLGRGMAKVRVTLAGEDDQYTVQRVIAGDKLDAHQTYIIDGDGHKVAARDKEVTAFIEKMLGIDADLFTRLLYIRQGEIRAILDNDKSGRNRLDSVIKIDALTKLQDSVIKEIRRSIEKDVAALDGQAKELSRQLSVTSTRLKEMEERITRINGELMEKEKEGKELEAKLSELEGEARGLEEKEKEAYTLRIQLSQLMDKEKSLKAKLSRLENELRSIVEERKRIEELRKRLDALRPKAERYGELRKREEELRKDHEELGKLEKEAAIKDDQLMDIEYELEQEKSEAEELRGEIKELEEKEKERREAMEEARSQLRETENNRAAIEVELKHVETEIELLRRGGSTCPLCGRSLTITEAEELLRKQEDKANELRNRLREKTREIEETQRRLRDAEEALNRLRSELSRKRGRLEDLEGRINQEVNKLNQVKGELGDIRNRIERLKLRGEEYEKIEEEIRGIRGEAEEYEKIEEEYRKRMEQLSGHTENEAAMLREQLIEVQREGENITARLQVLEPMLVKAGETKKKLEETKKKLEEVRAMGAELRGALTQLINETEKTRQEESNIRNRLEEARQRLGRLQSSLSTLNMLGDAVEAAKPLIRKAFIDAMNEELREAFTALRHKEAYVDIRMDGDYDIYVKRGDGKEIPLEALSMGEKNLVALIFRYAMAKVILGRIPIIMLDEPTEHLDAEHRAKVAAWLRDISSSIDVVLITSHIDSFENSADNVVRIEAINQMGDTEAANA
ncbi:MAG: SMC family ATPase [Thermocladium sp.]